MSRPTLNEIALKHPTDQSSNFHDYLGFLGELFEPLRDQPITLLEQGCLSGGMLMAYSEYFTHPDARIVGMDIENWPKCWKMNQPANVVFLLGSQSKVEDMKRADVFGTGWDVIIDDAGHFARAQMEAFAIGFPMVKPGGYYIIEDLHTAWSKQHCDANQTITQWLHGLGDDLHGRGPDAAAKVLPTDKYAQIHSITVRKGLAAIRKAI